MKQEKIRLLFVCMGNICRSPAAEGVMKKMVKEAGYEKRFYIDSAGTTAYHKGELPDSRMKMCASLRGYTLDSRSRPVVADDFYDFDLIIAMDDHNFDTLKHKAPDAESLSKIHKMTDYAQTMTYDHVPDPYYGGTAGFELVMDILEDACGGLLASIFSTRDN
ncbi:protein-tyrosine phosphatase [Parabacteroides sp. PF5-5]|uniref:low molecular weight protein-tyrosine-phosphatase n=1 Tax=unclassified Parabacteroides TaxID=2649774 RepID=UPI002473E7AC|nr:MULTISPECIES: low molecular weight protein-tyrosine-phosphatase [unclassified Parabacteroides]MDH6305383.1 protein-tyrosine phosphatase [Parabacteroides sp. PH5-39]MDH6316093.1 protein-tyrosine phosphatase [Parabacteroides sp. PF5-13]MDH6320243.1 protein-tyrosine phosphatase [Parabacteroides sp. PH5-13]MDH6323973.1 protein-tyrosine phosphatase [Parabacteroides sp. PH5-8]MDH6327284.1 protein-tyrosine phosphatase [Parabacteroides sp. PH5-41]